MDLTKMRMLRASLNAITVKSEENLDLLLGCILLVKNAIREAEGVEANQPDGPDEKEET